MRTNGLTVRTSPSEVPPMSASGRGGRTSKLVHLLTEHRSAYDRMIVLIRAGAYLRSAAIAVGVAPETVSRWLARGRREKRGPYRQFRQDVLQAVGEAAVQVEIEVRIKYPLVWLKCGPRRLLGDGMWQDQSTNEPTKIHRKVFRTHPNKQDD